MWINVEKNIGFFLWWGKPSYVNRPVSKGQIGTPKRMNFRKIILRISRQNCDKVRMFIMAGLLCIT